MLSGAFSEVSQVARRPCHTARQQLKQNTRQALLFTGNNYSPVYLSACSATSLILPQRRDDPGPAAQGLRRLLLLLITINHNSSSSPAIRSPAVGAHRGSLRRFGLCSRLPLIQHVCHGHPRFRQKLVPGSTCWFAKDRDIWMVAVAKARFLSFSFPFCFTFLNKGEKR